MNRNITKAFMGCSFYKIYIYGLIGYKYKTQSQNRICNYNCITA